MSSDDPGLGADGVPDHNPTRDGHTEDMLPEREVQFPPTVHHVHRRPLGLSPSPLLSAVAAIALVIAVILLALGSWLTGIVILVLSGAALGLFVVAVRQEPEAPAAQLAVTAAGRADGFARLAAVSLRASTRAALELARLWGRRRRIRFELRRRLGPLGEAVHLGDRERALQLKAQADGLDRLLQETDRRAAEAMATRRERIERERASSQSTRQLRVVDSQLDSRL